MKTLLEWLEENRGALKDGIYEVSCLGNIFCNDMLVNDDGCALTTDKYQVKNGNITLVTNKYSRQCKGITIDVYDILKAFEVTDPALQHLVKKALCAGLRGHKTMQQDLEEVLESAKRAVELNKMSKPTAEIKLLWSLDSEHPSVFPEKAIGHIFNDSEKRFDDGEEIMTSRILNYSTFREDGFLETRNTIYKVVK